MASPFSNFCLPSTLPATDGNTVLLTAPDQSNGMQTPITRRNSELPPGKRQSESYRPRGHPFRVAVTAPVIGGQLPTFAHNGSPRLNDFHQAAFTDFETLESPMLQLSPDHSPIMTQLMEATSPGTASSQSSNGSSISRLMRFSPGLHHHTGTIGPPFPTEVSTEHESKTHPNPKKREKDRGIPSANCADRLTDW
uniref:Uncharacterized protein n=1 Tax=Anopheles culicifacies TaxID=139723 RepID=A0A182MM20_9DIPT